VVAVRTSSAAVPLVSGPDCQPPADHDLGRKLRGVYEDVTDARDQEADPRRPPSSPRDVTHGATDSETGVAHRTPAEGVRNDQPTHGGARPEANEGTKIIIQISPRQTRSPPLWGANKVSELRTQAVSDAGIERVTSTVSRESGRWFYQPSSVNVQVGGFRSSPLRDVRRRSAR
jgi:hypothetical protein